MEKKYKRSKGERSYGTRERKQYSLQEKINYYGWVNEVAINQADLVIRLEDLCYYTEYIISNLMEFAEVKEYDKEQANNIIQLPETIGRGQEFYNTVTHPIIERLGY